MCKQYNSKQIANEFLVRAWNDNEPLNHLMVQRLVYLACGFSLGFRRGQMCIESPKAMEYGPIFSSLYKSLLKYGSGPVLYPIRHYMYAVYIPKGDIDVHKLLNAVWGRHHDCDGVQLMAITNREGTPWFETWDDGKGSGKKINEELTKKFFAKLVPETTIKSG